MKPSRHPEATGFVGGRDLMATRKTTSIPDPPGRKFGQAPRRCETHTIIDWTAHEAVMPVGDDGRATNTLEMRVRAGRPLLVNGVEVAKLTACRT